MLAALLILLIGDAISTFVYHVPEHVWHEKGYHLAVHHSPNRSFLHYAVLNGKPAVLLDGFLGACPYLVVAACLVPFDLSGCVLGLILGQLHVWWRHTPALSWKTPSWLQRLCAIFWIVTPEQHWIHHNQPNHAFGDIFTFYEKPARAWLLHLQSIKKEQLRRIGK